MLNSDLLPSKIPSASQRSPGALVLSEISANISDDAAGVSAIPSPPSRSTEPQSQTPSCIPKASSSPPGSTAPGTDNAYGSLGSSNLPAPAPKGGISSDIAQIKSKANPYGSLGSGGGGGGTIPAKRRAAKRPTSHAKNRPTTERTSHQSGTLLIDSSRLSRRRTADGTPAPTLRPGQEAYEFANLEATAVVKLPGCAACMRCHHLVHFCCDRTLC